MNDSSCLYQEKHHARKEEGAINSESPLIEDE